MNEYVIETKQLTKSYGSVLALDHVDLHVKKDAIYDLVGDNGAGKSTLFKLLAGHALPTSGEIQLLGNHEAKGLNRSRKHTGFIIEQPGFFPNMTVERTLEYYRIQKGVPDKKKTEEMLQLTQIEHKRKSKCKNLSLGQKQRLGLAIAMIGEPSILILDEPINGLDPSGIIELRNLLHHLNEEKNVTLLLSSHILTELQQLATIYEFLNKGTLIEEISAKDLLEKCSNCIEMKLSDIAKYVNTALPDHAVWVWGEETALERVFSNLLQNTGRYADNFLKIYLEETSQKVVVHFENDTKFLSVHDIKHLFDRFYMKDHSRNQGGTGLGLTIAKSLVEKMGGSLSVHQLEKYSSEKNASDNITLHFELCTRQCGKH